MFRICCMICCMRNHHLLFWNSCSINFFWCLPVSITEETVGRRFPSIKSIPFKISQISIYFPSVISFPQAPQTFLAWKLFQALLSLLRPLTRPSLVTQCPLEKGSLEQQLVSGKQRTECCMIVFSASFLIIPNLSFALSATELMSSQN